MTNTFTQKVVIKNDRAVGVQIGKNPRVSTTINANKEVILSAGTFGSPQILMLSGIGGKEELKEQEIDCLKNLSGVGKNLQDHVFYNVSALSTIQEGQNHHIKAVNQVKDTCNGCLQKVEH